MRARSVRSRGLLANPFVALADILAVTFFVLVLFLYAGQYQRLASADPKIVKIQQFKSELGDDLRAYWRGSYQDEADSANHEQRWWTRLSPHTYVILKEDASSIKMIFLGGSANRALFTANGAATPWCRTLATHFARSLDQSRAAHELGKLRAYQSITVEGYSIPDGREDETLWTVSVNQAMMFRNLLEEAGTSIGGSQGSASLFWPGRYSVVGYSRYHELPYHAVADPRNRRVQVEIRFTGRYLEEAESR